MDVASRREVCRGLALIYSRGEQKGILLRMRQYILFDAFGAIVRLSARSYGFSTGWSTLFYNTFWRGMKENDKYTNISNSVDTRGVCWPLWWGYFNDQSTNKTRKKPENLKFEIWFTEDQDVLLVKITKLYSKTIVRYLIRWKKLI